MSDEDRLIAVFLICMLSGAIVLSKTTIEIEVEQAGQSDCVIVEGGQS